MKKTSFHFPVVLLVVAAEYLLSAALWAAEGPGGTGAGTGASHILDGKTFVAQSGEKEKQASNKDTIVFRDGRFLSEGCSPFGFKDAPYQATVDGAVIRG